MAESGSGQFEISSVLSRTFETIGSNLVLFVGLALIFSGIPSIALQWWQAGNEAQQDPSQVFTWANLMPVFVGWAVGVVSGAVLQAALTRATVMYLSGERPSFGQCLTAGISMILPMIALGLLMTFGLAFAAILLIIPAIILWTCWTVVVPAYVQEKIGIFEAFGRSMALTKGARWRIFLMMLILLVGFWLISIPVGMATVALAVASDSTPVIAIFSGAVSAILGMVMVTVQASIYVELRDVKEGVAPAELEAIFA